MTRYWAIRTDTRNNTPYIWRELQAGRLRQGWSRRPDEDLEIVAEVRRLGGRLSEGQQETWRRNRRLLADQPGGVQVGDLAVLPHLPQYGLWTIARVNGAYRFSIDDGRNYLGKPDFGHIVPVEIVSRSIPWKDPAISSRMATLMRRLPPMWSIDPVGAEVEQLAKDFAL